MAPGQGAEPVEDEVRAFLIGLNRHAEPLPAGRRHIGENRLDHVQRQVQPVRFLGVHAQPDVHLLRLPGQPCEPGHELFHDPFALGELVAGMEGRELDRHTRPLDDTAAGAFPSDGRDGPGIGLQVALGVGRGARRLAQHIVRIPVAAGLGSAGPFKGFFDGAPHDELAPEDTHGLGHGPADQRLAALGHQTAQERTHVPERAFVHLDHAAGEHQRPGGGIDEQGVAGAQVPFPVGVDDLVADQAVCRFGVGDAQQRLRQAHEHNAFAVGQPVFAEEIIQSGESRPAAAHLLHQAVGGVGDAPARFRVHGGVAEERLETSRLVGPVGRLDGAAQGVRIGKLPDEWHGTPLPGHSGRLRRPALPRRW